MKARRTLVLDAIRNGYWFVPAVMTVGAVLLSVFTLWVDEGLTSKQRPDWLKAVVYSGGADGAREVLSAIAGSMITVAGVVFSITIVALTLASNQFGPRLLSNFMSDRGNQITLGTFVSAFIYSLLILRKTRTGDVVLVPHLSVAVALLMALAGIAVLIFFIHHVAAKIQAPNLVASVGRDVQRYLPRLFPDARELDCGTDAGDSPRLADASRSQARFVTAERSGYVGVVSLDGLLKAAGDEDLLIRLETRPGRFIVRGTKLASAWPAERVSDEVASRIAGCVVTGSRRTPVQDAEFPMQQLVEIAVRSLSPGINDPYTATSCIDQLSAGLCLLADRDFPSGELVDQSGALRVIVSEPVTFDELVAGCFDAIRQCASFHTSVYLTLLRSLLAITACTGRPSRRSPLMRQARLVLEASEAEVKQEADRATVRTRFAELEAAAR